MMFLVIAAGFAAGWLLERWQNRAERAAVRLERDRRADVQAALRRLREHDQ